MKECGHDVKKCVHCWMWNNQSPIQNLSNLCSCRTCKWFRDINNCNFLCSDSALRTYHNARGKKSSLVYFFIFFWISLVWCLSITVLNSRGKKCSIYSKSGERGSMAFLSLITASGGWGHRFVTYQWEREDWAQKEREIYV